VAVTDAFSNLVLPIFRRVVSLVHSLENDSSPKLDDVKRRVRSWIEDSELRTSRDATLAVEFPLAKFAIVALIDELLTDSEWGKSDSVAWGSEEHVLEWDLYHDHNRAWKFYEHAEAAFTGVTQSRISSDPLETYLLCVALGFRGELKDDEPKFNVWVDRMYNKVCESSTLEDKPFSEVDAKGTPLLVRGGPGLLLKVSVLTSVTAIATLAAYLAAIHRWFYAITG
jgi:type VI secretion system protein ImpK